MLQFKNKKYLLPSRGTLLSILAMLYPLCYTHRLTLTLWGLQYHCFPNYVVENFPFLHVNHWLNTEIGFLAVCPK